MVRLPALCMLLLGSCPAQAQDTHETWLGYLTSTRLEGNALSGASGVIAVNLAAGDGNQQSNAQAIAMGRQAQVDVVQLQHITAFRASAPDAMAALIGGNALSGATGLIAINQASGVGNRETNRITMQVGGVMPQGIEEADSEALAALDTQSGGAAGGRPAASPSISPRSASVSGTALRGAEGVVQLNQIAGMGNTAGNRLLITVDLPPR